ncbi:unnamed protein product, partial [Pleuronectes platessa]
TRRSDCVKRAIITQKDSHSYRQWDVTEPSPDLLMGSLQARSSLLIRVLKAFTNPWICSRSVLIAGSVADLLMSISQSRGVLFQERASGPSAGYKPQESSFHFCSRVLRARWEEVGSSKWGGRQERHLETYRHIYEHRQVIPFQYHLLQEQLFASSTGKDRCLEEAGLVAGPPGVHQVIVQSRGSGADSGGPQQTYPPESGASASGGALQSSS